MRKPAMIRSLSTLLLLLASIAIVACGGGKEATEVGSTATALTDPRTVATATPWSQPPEPTYITGDSIGTRRASGSTNRYTVQAGDTLSLIAEKLGVDVQELMRINNITDPTRLRVGQELLVPAPSPGASPTATATPRPTTTATPTATPRGSNIYAVQAGDTPGGIASKFGVSVEELMRVNNITDPTKLRVGQELIIPTPQASPTPTARP